MGFIVPIPVMNDQLSFGMFDIAIYSTMYKHLIITHMQLVSNGFQI